MEDEWSCFRLPNLGSRRCRRLRRRRPEKFTITVASSRKVHVLEIQLKHRAIDGNLNLAPIFIHSRKQPTGTRNAAAHD